MDCSLTVTSPTANVTAVPRLPPPLYDLPFIAPSSPPLTASSTKKSDLGWNENSCPTRGGELRAWWPMTRR
jgi:hypothetical protein